jgi:uncharacterized integral membrane protein (TIGR00698 family)
MRAVTVPDVGRRVDEFFPAGFRLLPGLGLCGGVTLLSYGLEAIENRVFGRSWLEALVLAILLGAVVRTARLVSGRSHEGIVFAARWPLEGAVVLLGASVSMGTILGIGPVFGTAIVSVVVASLVAGYGIARLLGLPARMGLLVACGNAICGNSAIAAVAPVIGADGDDVAASIAFTAVFGVMVVLGLPVLGLALNLQGARYGALAGLTVYAVPQVLAATAPMGVSAVQTGTLVKLVRVLMLGPVCLALSVVTPFLVGNETPTDVIAARERFPLTRAVPWFVIGFLAMTVLRSCAVIPEPLIGPLGRLANGLTVFSMAALGLGVDMRMVAQAGARVSSAVTLSLLVLGGLSYGAVILLLPD